MNELILPRKRGRRSGGLIPKKHIRRSRRVTVTGQLCYAGVGFQGQGVLSDLSSQGCQIRGTIPVRKGVKLTISMVHPEKPNPLIVDKARVVWSKGGRFGLHFEMVYPSERQHLLELLHTLGASQISH